MKAEILQGDCLNVMGRMPDASIDLIATDPPFGTGRDWRGDAGEFSDKWDGGIEGFVDWMTPRLKAMRRVLKPSGSLYLHCDPTASHYLKVRMDAVFGRGNFRNEIVWCYSGPSASRRCWPRKHDAILFYGMGDYVFNIQRAPYSAPHGLGLTSGMNGRYDEEQRSQKVREGKSVEDWWGAGRNGFVWTKHLNGENWKYPTQKPLALYQRIIEASSNPGDTVLDPFCGSGTTVLAARGLGRDGIGIDQSADACELARRRLGETLL